MQALNDGWSIGEVLPGQSEPDVWLDVSRPGTLAALLHDLGLWSLDEPPRDFDAETWVWRLRFDRPADPRCCVLGLDGLATLCEVRLNGKLLLSSENMFQSHQLDVEGLLRHSGNLLTLRCAPLAPRVLERRTRPRWHVPMLRLQQLRWWRTTLLGRTPGWSVPAPPLGPWRGVWLAQPQALLPSRLLRRARVEGTQGVLEVALPAAAVGLAAGGDVDSSSSSSSISGMGVGLGLGVEVDDPDSATPWRLELSRGDARHSAVLVTRADGSMAATLRINDVALWWPHTHGEPALYQAELVLKGQRLALPPVGFRSISCQREGGDFALQVNGVAVFARGACWTPLDPLRLHAEPGAYASAVAQVRAAGMNMLRVTGSMVYESQAFFDACDSQGVMVWQDFMFANMDYPEDDPGFMASVQTEVLQQLQSWQGRPSLVVLCGNSEVEQQAAMWGAARALWQPPLFHHTLAAWCATALPDTPYWPSSAHGGATPFAPDTGTTSYYGVGAYMRPLDDAAASGLRFATECLAFAQLPENETLERMPGGRSLRAHHGAWKDRSPRDVGAGWDFEDVRDHYVARLFGVEPASLRYSDHERYLMLGRVAVARVVAASFSRWRSAGSPCRGALVWFLRDLWAGAGWGLLDDQGGAKSAWHALSEVLQPTTLLLTDEGLNGLRLHLVNESAEALNARLEVCTWRGEQRLVQVQREELLAPRSTRALPLQDLCEHFSDFSWAYRFGPPPFDFLRATLRRSDGVLLGTATHLCAGYSGGVMSDPGLKVQWRRLSQDSLQIDVQTRRAALAVHFEVEGHSPEQAYFDLAPGDKRSVLLRRRPGTPMRAVRGMVLAVNAAAPAVLEHAG